MSPRCLPRLTPRLGIPPLHPEAPSSCPPWAPEPVRYFRKHVCMFCHTEFLVNFQFCWTSCTDTNTAIPTSSHRFEWMDSILPTSQVPEEGRRGKGAAGFQRGALPAPCVKDKLCRQQKLIADWEGRSRFWGKDSGKGVGRPQGAVPTLRSLF